MPVADLKSRQGFPEKSWTALTLGFYPYGRSRRAESYPSSSDTVRRLSPGPTP